MTVDLYTLSYNEMRIAPFVVQYWKRFVRKAYIFDNGSDDGTIEYLSQFPFIEMGHFDSEGLDDAINVRIKNSVWKNSVGTADFVVVCDFDECLYSKDLFGELQYMKDNGMSMCKPIEYMLLGREFPKYDGERFSHEIMNSGYRGDSKIILLDPNLIEETNWLPGCHVCHPKGIVKMYDGDKIFTMHHSEMSPDYCLDKFRRRRNRFSSTNMKYGYGTFYFTEDGKLRHDLEEKLRERCVSIKENI